MTALTLPRSFSRAWNGTPFYFVSANGCAFPLAWRDPFLPAIDGAHWSDPAEIAEEHIDLSVGSYAELFFLADINPADIDTDDAQAVQNLARLIDQTLRAWDCDLTRCASEVAGELADCPQSCARWNRCVTLAARLLGVTP